jgi:hypothetical protein
MRSLLLALPVLGLATGLLLAVSPQEPANQEPVGYEDTPYLPGGKWRVHDKFRPVPDEITPGKPSTQAQVGSAPSDAIVLFDGSSLEAFDGGPWDLKDGVMTVNGKGDVRTKQSFGDVQLHVEWRSPDEPNAKSQGKGNSGVFLMGRYEIQVLNSYRNRSYADGQAASLYGQKPPDVNATLPTGMWQSYDIIFKAPRFDEDGKLSSPAVATVLHNGVLVQNHVELLGPTSHRSLPNYKAHAMKLPIKLQDHGNKVSYRNIWVREL